MKVLNYISLTCVLLVAVSMFLPVYETWVSEYEIDKQTGIGISAIYQKGKTEFIVVHNGFGSFYAMGSCFVTFFLTIGILFLPRENSIPIISVIIYLSSLILLRLGMIPFDDKMLVGFYLMFISQTILIILSFYKRRELMESEKYHSR
jgi:hypothetical protein